MEERLCRTLELKITNQSINQIFHAARGISVDAREGTEAGPAFNRTCKPCIDVAIQGKGNNS